MEKKLYAWQEKCLQKWESNNFKGIVNVVTGAGKTFLALGAIEMLEKKRLNKNYSTLKIKIIVPKIFLVFQWIKVLQQELSIERKDIGCYYGLQKQSINRKYMIYVINSARLNFSRHVIDDISNNEDVFLIADECHNYGTVENSKIFDFVKNLNPSEKYYALGLSATPKTLTSKNIIEPMLGPIIFNYGFNEALYDNIINDFAIFNISLPFTNDELEEYLEFSNQIKIMLSKIRNIYPSLSKKSKEHFFMYLRYLSKNSKKQDIADLANNILISFYRRKELVYQAENRISCIINLINQIPIDSKIIIFGERINMAEILFEKLNGFYPNQVGIYHSKTEKNYKENILKNYENGYIRILVSCKSLDEGLNIPFADVGIVVSCSSSKRQRIQRLGRILRRSQSKQISYLYYLFISDCSEDSELLSTSTNDVNVPIFNIDYEPTNKIFINETYDNISKNVVTKLLNKNFNSNLIYETC